MKEKKIVPTQEQLDILEAVKHTRVLKVNAIAGSGKSSTLKLLAQHNDDATLYVCFNKVIAEEAQTKFPSHVECRTTHSLAYSKYGRALAHKLNRPTGKYRNVAATASEVVIYYNVKDMEIGDDVIPARTIASFALQVVKRYECSDDAQITKMLLPVSDFNKLHKEHPNLNKKLLGTQVLTIAKKIWNDRVDPSSEVKATHDTYLKLWQLSAPVLDYDFIFIDEAQDTNPVVLDVLRRQTQCKIIYVGDEYQSIYAFRGAVNAMEQIDAPSRLLSKSFRYGQAIADVATNIINQAIKITGNEEIESSVGHVKSDEYTMIFRTNAALLERAVYLIREGKEVFCEADTKSFIKKLESAEALFKDNPSGIKHEDIVQFPKWSDLVEAAEEDAELKRIMSIVDKNKTGMFIKALSSLEKKSSKAQIILTTAHKSKGKEWDHVILADDYPVNAILSGNQQEINLLYVAATRAIKTLQLPKSLDFYSDILKEGDE